ncbi:MAG: hypothetical protein PSN46_04200 [Gammaproteobacteria bacterium]|nr:hypothetical protein [Gammaproteobacteria bacterium]
MNNAPIDSFWKLVSDNADQLRSLVNEESVLAQELLEEVQDHLADIDPHLTVFCARNEAGTGIELVFGCDGYSQSIDTVLFLVAAAPKLEDIKVFAFNPRVEQIPEAIEIGDAVLELDELFFGLRSVGEELHLDLYLEELPMLEDAPETDAALMFLDVIVGEYDLMTRIHSVNWLDLPEDPLDHGLKPLIELRQQFDLLRPKCPLLGEALH